MANKQVRIGALEDVFQYDDGDFPKAISADDPIECTAAPVGVDDVLRLSDVPTLANIVAASANITDNAIVRGDGGAKGIQDSAVSITDGGSITIPAGQTVDGLDPSTVEAGAEVNELVFNGTNGIVLRRSLLQIEDGTNANTIQCTLTDDANGDAIGATDNIALGATTGDYTLNAGGTQLIIENSGLSDDVIAVLSVNLFVNTTGTALLIRGTQTGADIVLEFRDTVSDGIAGGQDITSLADTGDVYLYITYITAS